jgi:hypothetical protein
MEEGGFKLALMNAVIAATRRSKELGEALQKPSPTAPPGRTKAPEGKKSSPKPR